MLVTLSSLWIGVAAYLQIHAENRYCTVVRDRFPEGGKICGTRECLAIDNIDTVDSLESTGILSLKCSNLYLCLFARRSISYPDRHAESNDYYAGHASLNPHHIP